MWLTTLTDVSKHIRLRFYIIFCLAGLVGYAHLCMLRKPQFHGQKYFLLTRHGISDVPLKHQLPKLEGLAFFKHIKVTLYCLQYDTEYTIRKSCLNDQRT